MSMFNETMSSNVSAAARNEGDLTRRVEVQTSKIPSMVFLAIAGGFIAASLGFKLAGNGKTANFVGQWVPTVLLLGIYNKLVKEHG
jgi:hypothetical protein